MFQDTLRASLTTIHELGCIQPGDTLASCIEQLTPIKWTLPDDAIMWKPAAATLATHGAKPASDYSLFLALYWRVNGASSFFASAAKTADANLRERIRGFIDAHVALAMRMDRCDDPSDAVFLTDASANVRSLGPCEWLDERDTITKLRRLSLLSSRARSLLSRLATAVCAIFDCILIS